MSVVCGNRKHSEKLRIVTEEIIRNNISDGCRDQNTFVVTRIQTADWSVCRRVETLMLQLLFYERETIACFIIYLYR